MPSATAETAPTKRDRHLQLIAERGRRPFTAAHSDDAPARKSLRAKALFTDNWCAPKRLDSGAENNLLNLTAAGVYARYTGCASIADPGCLATQTKGATLMPLSVEDFYRSSNGDRWQLIRDTTSGVSFVRHEPNLASGGRVTDTDVEEFLNRTGSSPENLALRALLDKYPGTEKS
jgi:hypothetical protein